MMNKAAILEFSSGKLTVENLGNDYIQVRVSKDDLRAAKKVYLYSDLKILKSLFSGMAENWEGWTGSRHFNSIEGDFKIVANHISYSHVLLRIDLLSDADAENPWSIAVEAKIDIGSLNQIAKDFDSI